MLVGPLRLFPEVQAVFRQPHQHRADAGVLFVDHAVDAAADGRQLLGGRHAREIAAADFGRPAAHQSGHPDQEELVQIRADDGQELEPLQQGQFLGQPLLQHAVVELQPAQLAVEEQVGGFEGIFGHNAAMLA